MPSYITTQERTTTEIVVSSALGEGQRCSHEPEACGDFMRVDPNVEPLLWELNGNAWVRSRLGATATAIKDIVALGAAAIHLSGLPTDQTLAPAPYIGRS